MQVALIEVSGSIFYLETLISLFVLLLLSLWLTLLKAKYILWCGAQTGIMLQCLDCYLSNIILRIYTSKKHRQITRFLCSRILCAQKILYFYTCIGSLQTDNSAVIIYVDMKIKIDLNKARKLYNSTFSGIWINMSNWQQNL